MDNDIQVTFTIPERIFRELMACYKIQSFEYPDFHPIWDNEVNGFLTKQLNLVTDSPIYNLNNAFRLFFRWDLQIWYVG